MPKKPQGEATSILLRTLSELRKEEAISNLNQAKLGKRVHFKNFNNFAVLQSPMETNQSSPFLFGKEPLCYQIGKEPNSYKIRESY